MEERRGLAQVEARPEFTNRELLFIQAEIDGLRIEEFEQRYGIGRKGRKVIRENLEEKFAGEVAARGLWLATVEAVRQHLVNTSRLQPPPKGSISVSEGVIVAMMYQGTSNGGIALRAKVEKKAVSGIINGIVRKEGFDNPIQLLAWIASADE